MKFTLKTKLLNSTFKKYLILATALVAYILILKSVGNGSICLFRNLTGLPCPGCGLTHAGIALLHGNITMAWHYNPTIFIVIILVTTLFIKSSELKAKLKYLYLLSSVVILGYYIYRMVTIFPDGDYPMLILPNSILEQLINFSCQINLQ